MEGDAIILVPIKDLRGAKQRLSPLLSPDERAALARAMAEDVFDALVPFVSEPGVAVVTADPWVAQQATARKFAIIVDHAQAGETAAIELGTSFCVLSNKDF